MKRYSRVIPNKIRNDFDVRSIFCTFESQVKNIAHFLMARKICSESQYFGVETGTPVNFKDLGMYT